MAQFNKLLTSGFTRVWRKFNRGQRRKTGLVFFIIVLNSIIDIVALSSVLPAISVTFNPELIKQNKTIGSVYQSLHFQSEEYFILFLFSAAFALILFRNIFSIFTTWIQTRFSNDIAIDFSIKQLNYYISQNLHFIKTNNSSQLVRYVHIVPQQFCTFILQSYLTIFSEGIVILIIVAGLMAYNPFVFLLMLGTITPFTVVFYLIAKKIIQKNGNHWDYYNRLLSAEVNQVINGYIDVKIYSKEKYFTSRFKKFLQPIKSANVKLFVTKSLSGKIIELIAFTGVLIILIYAIAIGGGTGYILGLIGIYFTATYRLIPTYNKVLHGLLQIKEYSYIFEVFEKSYDLAMTKQERPAEGLQPLVFSKELSINNLSFRYDQAKDLTIKQLNFTIKKGDIIGIIGRSGSGKTTLINILLRFITEQSGDIKVDNSILTAENIISWRNLIGYVQQNVFVIDGDFYENIALGVEREQVDMTLLNKVIRLANLAELVAQLPDGLDTRLGENGSLLSGGQKQRIVIARALYRQAEVFIFDEATSALDNETENEINKSIQELSQQQKTILIVAHRYTSLKNCSRILEMENGKIAKEYTYEQLIREKKIFETTADSAEEFEINYETNKGNG